MDTPLDLDRVVEVLSAQKIPDWDREVVGGAVVAAIGRFVDEDWAKFDLLAVEEYGEEPFRYKIDLVLRDRLTGRITIADWKTRDGKLDEKWELRETRSYQPRLYALVLADRWGDEILPVNYEVRGVTLESEPQIKVLRFSITHEEVEDAIRYMKSVEVQRLALVNIGDVPWTRNPSGCRAFGPMYPCEFEPYCWERGGVVPEGQPESPLSYSAAGEFLRCPERYRLLKVLGKLEDEEEKAAKGTAFHRVLENVYGQLKAAQERLKQ